MKKICVFIAMLFWAGHLLGQNKNQLNEMIVSSINSYIEWNNDFVKRGISVGDTCNHYICIDGLPSSFPYDSIKNATFFSVNFFRIYPVSNSLLNKQLKKGIEALFVYFELKNNQLQITVSSKSVKLVKKKQIGVGLSDWGIYTHEYSCEKQEWELKETKYGGV